MWMRPQWERSHSATPPCSASSTLSVLSKLVATPLANLIAREAGFVGVLLCAAILYGVALLTFPVTRRRPAWHRSTQPSPAVD